MVSPESVDPQNSVGRIAKTNVISEATHRFNPRLITEQTIKDTSLERHGLVPIHEFIERAKENPALYLRNSAQYLADAFIDFGFEMRESYGRMVPHYHCLDAPWLPERQKQRKIPRDCDPFAEKFVQKLQEAGMQSRPEKGIIVRSKPGVGKDVFFRRAFETFEQYNHFHVRGIRDRLAFRFKDESAARKIVGFNLGANIINDSRGFIIPSPTNCNPIFILSNRAGLGGQKQSEREKFVIDSESTTTPYNTDFVLANDIDPMSAKIFQALISFYNGDVDRVLKQHVYAEHWKYNAAVGDGVYRQLPSRAPFSSALPLFPKHLSDEIPRELNDWAKYIPSVVSPFLRADCIYFEDMLADSAAERSKETMSSWTFLLSLIEQGDMQVGSDHFFLTLNKDAVFIATINDDQIETKAGGDTWEPLTKRFITLGMPSIRQFREEVAAQKDTFKICLGSIAACPHVLETACLFFVATRLLNPQASNYDSLFRKTDDNLGAIAEKLIGGVRKAIFYQSSAYPGRHQELNLSEKWPEISSEEIKILRQNETLIEQEYLGNIDKLLVDDMYEGGFGIPTRDVKEHIMAIASSVKGHQGSEHEYIAVLDVVNYLKRLDERVFGYFQNFSKQKERLIEAVYKQKCVAAQIKHVDSVDFETSKSTDKEFNQAKTYYEVAKKLVDQKYPTNSPSDLVRDIELYALYKVREDIRHALNIDPHTDRLEKYIFHVISFVQRGATLVPDKYRTVKAVFQQGKDPLDKAGVDLSFMNQFEQDAMLKDETTDLYRTRTADKVMEWAGHQGLKLEQCIGRIRELDRIQQIVAIMDEKAREAQNQKIVELWELSERYTSNPGLLESDRLIPANEATIKFYEDVWQRLKDMGYAESSIRPHLKWAFEKVLKGK